MTCGAWCHDWCHAPCVWCYASATLPSFSILQAGQKIVGLSAGRLDQCRHIGIVSALIMLCETRKKPGRDAAGWRVGVGYVFENVRPAVLQALGKGRPRLSHNFSDGTLGNTLNKQGRPQLLLGISVNFLCRVSHSYLFFQIT